MNKSSSPPNLTTTGKPHYALLDGLRGVAAMSVMLYHVAYVFGGNWMFPHADLAVDFFFILSGFVVAHAYGSKLETGRLSLGGYIATRVIRLYPLIILGGFAGAAAAVAAGKSVAASDAILNALALPSYGAEVNLYSFNPPTWSIFYELLASLLFGLLYRWITIRRLAIAVAVSATAFIALSIAAGNTGLGSTRPLFPQGLTRVLCSFFGGVLIHRLHAGGRLRLSLPWWALAAGLLGVFAPPPLRFDVPLRLAVVVIVFPLLLVAASNSAPAPPVVERAFRLLGELSYPVYILHWPVFMTVRAAVFSLGVHGHHDGKLFGVPSCFAAVALAYLVLKVYDEPIRALLRRTFAVRAQAPAQTAP